MIRWKRKPLGYLSEDDRWFLERGALMTHGANAWLIWRQAEEGELADDGFGPYDVMTGQPARTLRYISGDEMLPETLFLDTHVEGGWLFEAKAHVLTLLTEREAAK